jgi:hypothetical protein
MLILGMVALVAGSWLTMATLLALSIRWPASHGPAVLLGAWVVASAWYVARPDQRNSENWRRRILAAPAWPLFLAGRKVWAASRR